MIVQEPVQAAIWHCLNHYDYSDAVFLSERFHAEVESDDSRFLLATSYYRNGQKHHAYHVLKDKVDSSTKSRYLLGVCAFDLEKYAEAEAALLPQTTNNLDDIISEYGEQASFALGLLGKIAAKTERKSRAIEAWKKALKLNPFQWSSYEMLCKIGDKPNPHAIFQISGNENLTPCQGTALNSVESIIINPGGIQEAYVATPQCPILINVHKAHSKHCTPEQSPVTSQRPLWLSGFVPLSAKVKPFSLRMESGSVASPHPTFGQFTDTTDSFSTPQLCLAVPPPARPLPAKLTESNTQSLAKRMRSHHHHNHPNHQISEPQFISRRESAITKPLFSQSTNTNVTKTPTTALNPQLQQLGQQQQQQQQNVRRSSRLFPTAYSVKENNKSPNRTKFVTPKSPSRKTKQRIVKNLNKCAELNTRNRSTLEKSEKSETITTTTTTANNLSEIIENNNKNDKNLLQTSNIVEQALLMQRQSAEGLMALLRTLGEAFVDLCTFNCKSAIDKLKELPANQFTTVWVYNLLGLGYFEQADYKASIKYFGEVHAMEPHHTQYMDIYSTALWHLQKEVLLSALAQDLIAFDRNDPIAWCVNGNCFSLQSEHDTAIKYFQRAVQVDPNFAYAYTLLGHEYITTEELDKATSCFRSAVRLDPRHYNAWFGIGIIYSKQERYELAEIHFARALAINPRNSVLLCHIGIVQHALKNTERALRTFDLAVANNAEDPRCKFHRSSLYFALGRHSEALKELEELKAALPKESRVYYLIGQVHKKLGNTDLALMHFSWATDLDPKGATSQIKEAFDPGAAASMAEVGRAGTASPEPEEEEEAVASPPPAPPARLRAEPMNFGNLPDDSEDSF